MCRCLVFRTCGIQKAELRLGTKNYGHPEQILCFLKDAPPEGIPLVEG